MEINDKEETADMFPSSVRSKISVITELLLDAYIQPLGVGVQVLKPVGTKRNFVLFQKSTVAVCFR